MMTFSQAMASAPSVPGLICRNMSARVAKNVTRGSTTIILLPRFMQSMTQCPKKPSAFEFKGLFPQTAMQPGAFHSGLL